eukprot:CAMPEP_0197882344 /NCGR_PEP_ID=MMETSP1439-20131203/9531_1 /TAXON_ID=66791 /ORGANISM="Gonyaulax spinifera, Strain CCMP409" /LENGTH=86 /DNA_ID=CAMNT_0043501999 /DNA_START=49 /DNA_END=305 /DNA_ORIENTATION=+
MASVRRPVLPAVAALALGLVALAQFLGQSSGGAFLAQPAQVQAEAPAELVQGARQAPANALALGAAAGLLTAQPAHAGILFDEIIP